MAQQLEIKQKEKTKETVKIDNKKVRELVDWAKQEFDNIDTQAWESKAVIIRKLGTKLENEASVPKFRISALISQKLKGRVSAVYVNKCLSKDQKDSRKVRDMKNAKRKNPTSSTSSNITSDSDKQILQSRKLGLSDESDGEEQTVTVRTSKLSCMMDLLYAKKIVEHLEDKKNKDKIKGFECDMKYDHDALIVVNVEPITISK